MGKLKVSHFVETSVWIAIILIFFAFWFEFDQEIEIYIFGATGWPRVILGILLFVVLGNFFQLYKKGSEGQQSRIGITEDDEGISYNSFRSVQKLVAILLLPFFNALSLKPVGF